MRQLVIKVLDLSMHALRMKFICDNIKVEALGCYVGNGRKSKGRSSSRNRYNNFDFIANMLCNNAVGCGEANKERILCEIRGHIPAQETAIKPQTEAVNIRALSVRDLRKKINLAMDRKETFCICYQNAGLTLRPSQACANYLCMNSWCNVQSHCWPYTANNNFSQSSCLRINTANDGRQCFGNFCCKSRGSITKCTERTKDASRLCSFKESEQVHFT